MNKLKLALDISLPHDAGACATCVERLLSVLRGRQGIEDVHIDAKEGAERKLCLHFDPGVIRPERIEALVRDAGGAIERRHGHLAVEVLGLRHERQAKLAEATLAKVAGVVNVAVTFGTKRLFVGFDPEVTTREKVLAALPAAGLEARTPTPRTADPHKHREGEEHAHGGIFGERTEIVFSLFCGALTAAGWSLGKVGVGPALLPTVLFVVAYVFGGWFTVKEVAVALRARQFEIDFLMLLAAIGAAALGEWFEGALLLFLFTIGHALEGYAMGRARKAIEALAALVPPVAQRQEADGRLVEVPVGELAVGDHIVVKPNSRIPADGVVLAGASNVDQAPITGESMPVEKRAVAEADQAADASRLPSENRVFAATINGASALTVRVSKVASDSTLARVVKMVAEAETQKSSTQLFTDRFEKIFVPVILALVGLLLFAWVVVPETFAASFYRAMAVLVAASPCALAIATPSAVLSGVARAARGGVLVKGGAHLETLGTIGVFAFDKTGTLTEGKPKLTDVAPARGIDEVSLLSVTLAVEAHSDHPLARAIVKSAGERLPPGAPSFDAKDVEAIIGYGVRAQVDGKPAVIGKAGLFTRDGAALPDDVRASVESMESNGRTVMVVKLGEVFLGALGVMDTPRESARRVVAQLRDLGVERTIMLSGDNQRVAEAVAKEVGITEARGDLLPEQKVAVIVELARATSRVAMVGDGVNDAPAMANATVGIAMGAGGSDVALETADIALMGDDLAALPFAVGLSRAARAIIRQNLWASLGMVVFLVPATLFGIAGIGAAVALHEGSTLLVVANALRLLAYRNRASH